MNINDYAKLDKNEKPLDNLVESYSNTSIFRTIAFVGDSLSSGEFESRDKDGNPGWHDMYEYSWGQYLARQNGLKAYNFSKGGMTAKCFMESFAQENDMWSKEKAAQAYVIALGVNDLLNHNMEVGTVEDINKDDYTKNKPTFAGYYGAIISRYKEISPHAKFFFITYPAPARPGKEEVIEKMCELLYDLAKLFENSYVLDIFQYGNKFDDDFNARFKLFGHMNPSGYIFFAKMIDSYIDYIVRHNYNDFKTVGFINSGIDYI